MSVRQVFFALVALCATRAVGSDVELTVHGDQAGPTIRPEIYGVFQEHLGAGVYDGIWVGKDSPIRNVDGIRADVIDAFKALRIPLFRWPGGCFADQYHWRDGIGPQSARPKRLNSTWGGEETNAFGTHEFLEFCDLIGSQPYIAANVGTGTPQEMKDWLEYLTSSSSSALAEERRRNGRSAPWKIPYLGIGNESWGCGGNMRPEYYADLYRQFATFALSFSGNRFMKVGSGPGGDDSHWTETMMQQAGTMLGGLSLHNYTLPTGDWNEKGPGVNFTEKQWYETLRRTLAMDAILHNQEGVMDKFDAKKRVGLVVDEWGTWYDDDPNLRVGLMAQRNTMRDAVVAAINLNIFNRHCERVRAACLAQAVNVLQSLLLVKGNQTVKTPTYYVFDLFRAHEGADLLAVDGLIPQLGSVPALSVSASRDASGSVLVTLANLDPAHPVHVVLHLAGLPVKSVEGRYLTGSTFTSGNDFDHPDAVVPRPFRQLAVTGASVACDLPAASVAALHIHP